MRNWKEKIENSKEQKTISFFNEIIGEQVTKPKKVTYKIKARNIYDEIKTEAKSIKSPADELLFYKMEYENFKDEYEYELESGEYTHLNIIDRLFKKKIESLEEESNPQTATSVKRGVKKAGASNAENVSKESIIFELIKNLVKETGWNLIERDTGNKKNQKWAYTETVIYNKIKEHLWEDHRKGSVLKSIQFYRKNLLKKSKKTKE